jgi:glutathione-regulated potassium-efflux system ancillary protein KefF
MTQPPSTLVIYAHPGAHQSRVNQQLIQAARLLPGVEVLDLYNTYPDFYIDVGTEQARLERAGLVVLVHPIQWYSMPALMKEWIDVVFEEGWAYGSGGQALRGKRLWLCATAGGTADNYREGAVHGRPFDAYLAPYEQTATLCQMQWLPPLVLFGARSVGDEAVEAHVSAFTDGLRHYSQPNLADSTAIPPLKLESR